MFLCRGLGAMELYGTARAYNLLGLPAMRIAATATILIAVAIGSDPSHPPIAVPIGGDLQAALNSAQPGETILLDPGASYVGNFILPAKARDDNRVITVRTAGDRGLPGEGEQITPAATEHLARIRSPNGSPALQAAPGAHGWRIALIEFEANRDGSGDIIALGDGSSVQNTLARVPSGLTLDRLFIHGDPNRGQKRGIALNSAATTITGCYISDIKSVGQDSQAIGGWNGPGDYTITNNYLEAAGENIMFGGADPSILGLTPTNITIRNNVLSKPLAWREPGAPKWQIKNLLELKNARKVLIEGNLLERSWSQAQTGYAVLFTVRNQDGGCPWCQVEDIVFQRNLVRDMGAGLQILGTDNNHPSRQTNRLTIANNVFDGIDREAWGGDGYFVLLTGAPRDITIDHNTVIQRKSGGIVKIGSGITQNIAITNNIASHGNYGIIGTNHSVGNDSIAAYLPGANITRNVIAGGRSSVYPPGNLFPSVEEFQRQFVDAGAGDYRLVPGSPWLKAGTDRRDLGADIAMIPMSLAGPRNPDRRPPRPERPRAGTGQ
jgi:hypothetical protein